MIDWTKPVRTVGSKTPVTILSHKGPGNMSIVGYMEDGETDILQWYPGGGYSVDPVPHCLDLENVHDRVTYEPKNIQGWVLPTRGNWACISKEDEGKDRMVIAICYTHKDAERICRFLNKDTRESLEGAK